MKKLLVFFAAGSLLVVPVFAGAATLKAGENYTLAKGETIEGNFYAAGSNLTFTGNVKGDVSAAGGTLTLKGDVSDDVLFAGGTIIIDGSVSGDVRVVGGNVIVSGNIGGDLAVVAGTTRVNSGVIIGGDVLLAGGSVIFEAEVMGDVRLAGDVANFDGVVHGNLISDTERLTLGSKAIIEGDVINHSIKEVVLVEGAVIKGKLLNEPALGRGQGVRGMVAAVGVVGFFAFLLAGFVCFWLFRNRSTQLVAHALAHFGKEFLRGIICLIAIPIFALLLCITLVGAPIGIIGLLVYVGVIILAKVFAGVMLGGWINKVVFKKPDQIFTWQTVIGGNVILLVLQFVPILGGAVSFIFTLVAFGAFWGYIHRHFWVKR